MLLIESSLNFLESIENLLSKLLTLFETLKCFSTSFAPKAIAAKELLMSFVWSDIPIHVFPKLAFKKLILFTFVSLSGVG